MVAKPLSAAELGRFLRGQQLPDRFQPIGLKDAVPASGAWDGVDALMPSAPSARAPGVALVPRTDAVYLARPHRAGRLSDLPHEVVDLVLEALRHQNDGGASLCSLYEAAPGLFYSSYAELVHALVAPADASEGGADDSAKTAITYTAQAKKRDVGHLAPLVGNHFSDGMGPASHAHQVGLKQVFLHQHKRLDLLFRPTWPEPLAGQLAVFEHLPKELVALTSVEEVVLRGPYASADLDVSFLAALPRLRSFRFDFTHALNTPKEKTFPRNIGDLHCIEKLHLSNLNFDFTKGAFPKHWPGLANFPHLNHLVLGLPPLRDLPHDLHELKSLNRLEVRLNLHAAHREKRPVLAQLRGLKALRYLSLRDNFIQFWPEGLEQCLALETLLLGSLLDESEQRVDADRALHGLGELKLLKRVCLSGMAFKEIPEALKYLPQLQTLEARSVGATTLPRWLVQMPSVKRLDVSYNHFTLRPELFEGLVGLEALFLKCATQPYDAQVDACAAVLCGSFGLKEFCLSPGSGKEMKFCRSQTEVYRQWVGADGKNYFMIFSSDMLHPEQAISMAHPMALSGDGAERYLRALNQRPKPKHVELFAYF